MVQTMFSAFAGKADRKTPLTIEKMSKSVTYGELKEFVSIIGRLATIVQELCQTPTAFHEMMHEEYRDMAHKTMLAAVQSDESFND